MARTSPLRPAIAAAAVLFMLAAVLFVGMHARYWDEDLCLDARGGVQTHRSVWPPGAECVYQTQRGGELSRERRPPQWLQWTAPGALGLAVGLVVLGSIAALRNGPPRITSETETQRHFLYPD
jgi:hypothetical protein